MKTRILRDKQGYTIQTIPGDFPSTGVMKEYYNQAIIDLIEKLVNKETSKLLISSVNSIVITFNSVKSYKINALVSYLSKLDTPEYIEFKLTYGEFGLPHLDTQKELLV